MLEATRVASDVGKGFAVVLMILGGLQIFSGALIGGLWLIFIGMFLRGMAEAGYQELVLKKSLEGTRVQDVMIRDVVTAAPDLSIKRLIADYFLRYGYRGFPVTTNGKVSGMISLANVKDFSEQGLLNIVPYLSVVGWPIVIFLKYAETLTSGAGQTADFLSIALWPSVVYVGVQLLEGWLLTPWIQSGQTNPNAATVLVVVIIGGALGGILGLLFAIPIAACIKILLQEVILPQMRRWAGDTSGC